MSTTSNIKKGLKKNKIKRRIRGKISGTADRPRLSVFRSNADIYVQLINDSNGTTLCAASSREAAIASVKETKTLKAATVGKTIAARAIAAGITSVVFDRGGNLY
ncbi:MAG: 50S ribosomal protein L18, partial [Bacteroidota bacterium]